MSTEVLLESTGKLVGLVGEAKFHVFGAFKPSLNAPRANLAASGNSSWKNSGIVHLALLDAARQDAADNLQ